MIKTKMEKVHNNITDTLLTDPQFIREITNISDNVNGKAMMAAIRESQDIELQEIIGTKMLYKLKELVSKGQIMNDGQEAYLELLNKCQYFLAYNVVAKLCIILTYKIDNKGVVKTVDENVESLEFDDVYNVQEYYKRKADFFGYELQLYILRNKSDLPEISENCCNSIKATLDSSANPSLFLGGRRGKGHPTCCR